MILIISAFLLIPIIANASVNWVSKTNVGIGTGGGYINLNSGPKAVMYYTVNNTTAVNINSISISIVRPGGAGTGLQSNYLNCLANNNTSGVSVYQDVNSNGSFEPATDLLLGASALTWTSTGAACGGTSETDVANLTFNSNNAIPFTGSYNYFVVIQTNATLAHARIFSVQIAINAITNSGATINMPASSQTTSSITTDAIVPTVIFNGPTAGTWETANFNINISDSDVGSGLLSCEYMVESYNGSSWATTRTWTARSACNSATSQNITVGAALMCRNDGTNYCRITVRSTDVAGNITTVPVTLSIDYNPPALNVSSGNACLQSIAYSFTSNENAWCRWGLADLGYSAMTNNCSAGEGATSHTCSISANAVFSAGEMILPFYISCNDAHNNQHTNVNNYYIYKTLIPALLDLDKTGSGADLDLVYHALGRFEAQGYMCAGDSVSLSTTQGGSDVLAWTVIIENSDYPIAVPFTMIPGTTYYNNIKRDGVANYSDGFVLENVAPIITDGQSGDNVVRNASGTIYNVDFSDNGFLNKAEYVAYGLPSWGGSAIIGWTSIFSDLDLPTYTTDWQVNFAGLNEGSNYISVRVYDEAGNVSYATDAFYVKKDTLPPVQSAWNPTPGAYVFTPFTTVTFTTNEIGACKWSINDLSYSAMSNACSGGGTTSHSCSITGLVHGPNTVSLACVDSLPNEDTPSSNTDISIIYYIETGAVLEDE